MNFLHKRLWADDGDVIQLHLSSQANVMIMTDGNFSSYRSGGSFNYHGGLAKVSPARIAVPHSGHWNVVVDLGGYSGNVRVSDVVVLRG